MGKPIRGPARGCSFAKTFAGVWSYIKKASGFGVMLFS
ncbi:hypothetical protein AN403_6005 [Pseudomonas fluorescens]|uniref:Uncharacterized protein n=1 Tax=Pseudomonas fluorescens TaxID=294 RepID=A0A0P8Z8S4_PSEFL|nr:hypothetical protein AN403_6005 [Pseudomonas fluorescens]